MELLKTIIIFALFYTGNEKYVLSYEVESSKNKVDWTSINTINPLQDSSNVYSVSLNDYSTYYRIKANMVSGYYYSDTVYLYSFPSVIINNLKIQLK